MFRRSGSPERDMIWAALLGGLLTLVLLYFSRRRQDNEPPLDKGALPWLGHALEFGRDAAKFLARMKEKHGDVFTVRVAGQYITVLLDANSFDSVLNDTVSLDFVKSKNQLLERIFFLKLPGLQPAAEREWMEQHFHGFRLSNLSGTMKANIESLLLSDVKGGSASGWRQDGLFNFCYSLLFRAGYLTLFDSADNVTAIYKEFRKFDKLLSKLVRGSLKKGETHTVNSSRKRLWELLSADWLSRASGSISWQQSYNRFLEKEGVDMEMQRRASLLQLWTTQCNNGPAAFWLLGFLLTHPEAMEALKSEIRQFNLQDPAVRHQTSGSPDSRRTPVFDSILSETLRLTAAVLISRVVVGDKVLRMASGQQYKLRRGDKVILFPFLSPQMDPEIHLEPQSFKYDRFLNIDMSMKDTFYKNEGRLKYYTMPWGAGRHACVGKEFAVATIKQFVFFILTHFDLETCDPQAKLPPVNPSRYGLGMLQPEGELQVRYRLKRSQPET
ncbi:prostacyclin synthase isoform X2 [Takifugu rubripes]|uniref:Prostacyclin synthase n=1 Tax=Takifugu rubripes TaxID=31033 RepID=H2SUW3_TAKRU|nr:prostacyclin synthase-like isoform X2 [Takifugu rubripes]